MNKDGIKRKTLPKPPKEAVREYEEALKKGREKKLYLVRSVNQETGKDLIVYYLVNSLTQLENEVSDIIQIQPLTNFEDLTTNLNKKI